MHTVVNTVALEMLFHQEVVEEVGVEDLRPLVALLGRLQAVLVVLLPQPHKAPLQEVLGALEAVLQADLRRVVEDIGQW
jgi:hypothetical protein